MNSQMEELGLVIRADGTVELANGMKLTGEQVSNVGKKLDEMGAKLQTAEKGQKAVAASSKDMGKELSQAGDAAVSLGRQMAAGNWQQVAAEIAGTAVQTRVLGGGFLAAGAAAGVIALGVGAVALAAYEGAKAERALNDQLVLTGNFAGLVTGQLDAMAAGVARGINGTVGNSREVLAGLVSTGKFASESLGAAGTAALLLQRYTGETNTQVVRHFESMGDGVAKWAQKANESYHFVNLEQFKHIKQLEDQGKKQEAMKVTSEALAQHLGGDLTRSLGTLQRGWAGVASWASQAWDAMMGIGREQSAEEKIAAIDARIATIRNSRKGRFTPEQKDSLIAGLEADRAVVGAGAWQSQQIAEEQSKRQQKDQQAIDDLMKKHGKSPGERLAEQMQRELERLTYDADHALDLMNMSPERRQYMEVMRRLETDFKNGPQGTKDQMEEAASRRMTTAQDYRAALDISRGRQDRRNDEYRDAGRETSEQIAQRAQEAHKYTEQLVEETKRANLELITDDRQRAQAQLRVEIDGWKQRIERQREGSTERKTMEEEFAQWLVARQKQLTEQLKPEWQRMMESWGDSMKMMQDAHDGAMRNVVQGGEDLFVEWARTGKLSARNMVDGIIAEVARLGYRQYIAKPLASMANNFLGNLFGTGGGSWSLSQMGNMGADFLIPGMHSGGIAGGPPTFTRAMPAGAFAGAPRYHTGGMIGSDEVPIIAKKGEGVFTKEQMANLQPAGAGGVTVTYAPVIHIDARTDRAEVLELVGRGVRAGQADLLDRIRRGMT